MRGMHGEAADEGWMVEWTLQWAVVWQYGGLGVGVQRWMGSAGVGGGKWDDQQKQ